MGPFDDATYNAGSMKARKGVGASETEPYAQRGINSEIRASGSS